ncbi:MAG: HD domain-containing protein [Acidimicrobiia bacterium]|nr:HD domain-containing protein [Acidimicrobiia bacterium]
MSHGHRSLLSPTSLVAPAAARNIATAVRGAGGRALVVGGWVRNALLGAATSDVDLEVFGIPQERLPGLLAGFGRVEAVGRSFPVYKVVPAGGGHESAIDVALPRRESKSGRGHTAFDVQGDPAMSVADAARRRDFTINAISFDPLSGEIVDPCGGRADLERGVLQAVDPSTFGDDSLRVLRAVQFAARFDLELDPATEALCARVPLDDLPAERIWGEFEKLLSAPKPSHGFQLAHRLGVIERVLPELLTLVGCPQEPEWHPEGDVWTHTLLVVDQARLQSADLPRPERIAVMLAAVCHDLGKPSTTAVIEGRIRSLNHEEAGVEPTLGVLDRLNVHSMDGYDVRAQTVGLVAHHLKPGMLHKAPRVGDGAFRRLAQKVDLELLARLSRADCLGRTGTFDCSAMDWFVERARSIGVNRSAPEPLLLGRHLLDMGLKPGPRIGEILRTVYEQQLDGEVVTLDDAIAAGRRLLELDA